MNYIHYGNTEFDINLFQPIRNEEMFTKPIGGFWASPVDGFGWKEWNESSQFEDCNEDNSFTFALTDDAKVLHIRSYADLQELPKIKTDFDMWTILDFEELAKNYDAIELHLSEEPPHTMNESLYFNLYGWDCDSILIMNPDIIEKG